MNANSVQRNREIRQHSLRAKKHPKPIGLLVWATLAIATAAAAGETDLKAPNEVKHYEHGFYQGFQKPLKLSEQPTRPAQAIPPKGDHYSADDFYYWQGRRVPLHRSITEYAVRFQAGLTKDVKKAIVKAFSPSAAITEERQLKRDSLSIVKTQKGGDPAELEGAIEKMQAEPDVVFAAPVFIHPETQTKMLLTEEIVIKLKPGKHLEDLSSLMSFYGMTVAEKMEGTEDEYVLRILDPKVTNPLEAANAFFESGLVEWAQPNFIQEYQKSSILDDALLPLQWHLVGERNGSPTAHVDALAAWDFTQGNPNVTIAVLDDGVQFDHPDLADNIFINAGEVPSNGIDDDNNGRTDDLVGWDFIDNDNNPSPDLAEDNHGTSVAGVAAARGDNAIGVSGMCPRCKILPIRMLGRVTDSQISDAIRYAASLADVLNNSWGGGAPSSAIHSAIQYATTHGRSGRGSVVLFASGNSASGYISTDISIPAGTHRFMWVYEKDASVSAGDDSAWLGWARFPDGELVNFGNLPSGWFTGGHAAWSIVSDPTHADEGICFTHAAKAGAITDGQHTYLGVVKNVPAGDLYFNAWVSSEQGYDGLRLLIDLNNDGTWDWNSDPQSGVPAVNPGVSYPAAFPEAIAVGASSNLDCRSGYSQFGPELDIVAPSSAGVFNLRIVTTDRTGAAGYDPDNDYTGTFGGTSSATPLTAGLVGLILSRNQNLTQSEVGKILEGTADKIGPDPYDAEGRNERYGFGRVNAFEAVRAAQ